MTNVILSLDEQRQIQTALEYWCAHWDWESPTLFGIELEELQGTLHSWPTVRPGESEVEALAVIGSLRELLYGGSAPPREELESVVGLGYDAACSLCAKVQPTRSWRSEQPIVGRAKVELVVFFTCSRPTSNRELEAR